MIRSRFLGGVRTENAEAVRGQVWAYDHATVLGEVNRRVLGASTEAPSDALRHARDDGLVIPMGSDDWRAAKLARVLRHLGLHFSGEPSASELVDLCLEAEEKAVELLRRLQSPRKSGKGQEAFEGRDVSHLAQYILRRLFEDLDAGFARRPPEEQERIANEIAGKLAELPEDVRDRIRREAGITDLSAAALRKTGAIAAVGSAMAGAVGMAGFAAYTTLTSTIAAMAGLVGVHLPFLVYVKVATTAGSRAVALLGGADTGTYTALTLGDLVYDRVSIDPTALEAFEFAHKPAAGDIHRLAIWAHGTLNGGHGTVEGRINRLQGYVFERMAAAALRQSGAVVEFPGTANNPGWDLTVNGDKVQAKCGLSSNSNWLCRCTGIIV